jgi:hypothetical protein
MIFGRPRLKLDDNIKIDFKALRGCYGRMEGIIKTRIGTSKCLLWIR